MSDKMKSRSRGPARAKIPKLKELPPDLNAALFVETWNAATSLTAFSKRLGISASTCATYAARLREAGHELKWFRKGRPRLLKL